MDLIVGLVYSFLPDIFYIIKYFHYAKHESNQKSNKQKWTKLLACEKWKAEENKGKGSWHICLHVLHLMKCIKNLLEHTYFYVFKIALHMKVLHLEHSFFYHFFPS